MQRSLNGHLAAVLTGKDSDMQGIHPVMYLQCGYNQKWLRMATGIFTGQ
jgi:hypothetical protein